MKKILYLDCSMGAAGDMLSAALTELLPEPEGFVERFNALGIPGVRAEMEPSVKCGITGTHMKVTVNGAEEDEHLHDHSHDHSHDHGHEHDHSHEHSHDHVNEHDHSHDHDHVHGHSCEYEYSSEYVHEHGHEHDHEHEHGHEHENSHEYEHGHAHEHGHEHEHSHGYDHGHAHEHGHEYEHSHSHEHEHSHEHSHDHGHEHGGHHHSSMAQIEQLVRSLALPEEVKSDVIAVYGLIAEAESHAHGRPVTEIHFHEVGTMDAVADVTMACLLLHELAPDEIIASPVCVGSGRVRCAHGILPVPAPATAWILRGVPIYSGTIQSELCTPTGAALLKHFASRFGQMPIMRTEKIGYGMGKKDFESANCVRAMLGTAEAGQENPARPESGDVIISLSCNVDDMTAEAIGFAMERFLAAGARDVFTTPIGMKKSRPGVLLQVICTREEKEEMVRLLFMHTTTLGIREAVMNRYVLRRDVKTIRTECGDIRIKVSAGYGTEKEKYEFDDLARIAREYDMSLEEVRHLADEAVRSSGD